MDGIVRAFHGGGFWMWPILAIFVICWGITFERVYALYFRTREDKDAILNGLNKHVFRGDIHAAIRFLDAQRPGPLARILKAGLLKVHRPDVEVQASLDQASLREVPELEKRTGYLAVLSNAATLVGLVGTIVGLIHCFAAVANVDPAQKATILAAGIAEAMNCTAFGLITAIPALIAYAFLQARTQHLIDDINEAVVTELNLVLGNRRLFQNAGEEAAASTAK
jgi:biopolymer transport protein ExbB/TolQ